MRIGRSGWRRIISTRYATTAPPMHATVAIADPLPAVWLHIVFWSGLRGAVSTALALSLPTDFPNRAALQGITFGVVLFTLVVQATTVERAVRRWGGAPGSATDEEAEASGATAPEDAS